MKSMILAVCVAVFLVCPQIHAADEFSAGTSLTYESWSSDEDESGSQFFWPVQVQALHGSLAWQVDVGYASTTGDFEGDDSRSHSGLLDSQVGVSYTLQNLGGFDWLLGLDLNLPTGETGLDERDLRVMIDPDLVTITSAGRGFNVNPYLGAARQMGAWTLGLGAGYAFQGEYDFSEQVEEYDPGDILTLAAMVDYAFNEQWKTGVQVQYATTGTDQVEGDDLLERGDTWVVGANVQHTGDKWGVTLGLQTIIREKSKIRQGAEGLASEARESQGDEWIAGLTVNYRWRQKTTWTGSLRYLYLEENGYDESSVFYMGERQKISLQLGVAQTIADKLDLRLTLGGFSMSDDPNWLHPGEDRTYQGWSVTAAVTRQF